MGRIASDIVIFEENASAVRRQQRPVIILKNVLFPTVGANDGAKLSRLDQHDRLSAAQTPANRSAEVNSSEYGLAMFGRPWHQTDDAVGQYQHDADDQKAHQHRPVFRVAGEHRVQDRVDRGSIKGPKKILSAAEDRHDNRCGTGAPIQPIGRNTLVCEPR